MNSSGIRRLFGVLAMGLAFSAAACGKFGIKELVEKPKPLIMKGEAAGCLKGSGELISRYFRGEAAAEEIGGMFTCADNSIQLFLDRTRTVKPDEYAPGELRNFLEKFFIGEDKVSDSLMREAMDFKRSVLGGRSDALTRKELLALRTLIAAFRDQLVSLQPFMPITVERLGKADPRVINDVVQALARSGREVGLVIQSTAAQYSVARFEGLLREFERIFPGEGLAFVLKQMPLLKALKPFLLGTGTVEFNPEEWQPLLVTGARIYGLVIKSKQFDEKYKEASLACGTGRERLVDLADDLLSLLAQGVRHHRDDLISFPEFDRVFDSIDSEILGPVRPLSLKRLIRPIIRRVLGQDVAGATGREADGLTIEALARLGATVQRWANGQKYIEGAFKKLGQFSCDADPAQPMPHYLPEEINAVSIADAFGVSSESELDSAIIEAAKAAQTVVSIHKPLYVNQGTSVILNPLVERRRHSYYNLSMLQWQASLFRMGILGYREDHNGDIEKLERMTLTVDEFDQIYRDTRDLAGDLGALDPTQWDAGKLRFRDANLFLFASNGDIFIDAAEGTQLLAFLVSSRSMASEVHSEIQKECPSLPGGAFRTRLVDIKCYREKLSENFRTFFTHMPGLSAYFRVISADEQKAFLDVLFRVTKSGRPFPDHIELADADRLTAILHYVEAIYVAFDTNFSGTLEASEATFAFGRFEPIIARLAAGQLDSREEMEALFTYMLANGKQPESFFEKMGFWFWQQQGPRFWKFKTDRTTLLKIFEQLM